MCGDIDSILEADNLPQSVASTLRGRLQFAESQTFGRAVSLFMKTIHSRSVGSCSGSHISDEMRTELSWAKLFMRESPPRKLVRGTSAVRNLIFTDAFLNDDDNTAGVGMVYIRVCEGVVAEKKSFSEKVPDDVLKSLQRDTPRIIAALELLAAVQSVLICQEVLEGVDNEAARANLICMSSQFLCRPNC